MNRGATIFSDILPGPSRNIKGSKNLGIMGIFTNIFRQFELLKGSVSVLVEYKCDESFKIVKWQGSVIAEKMHTPEKKITIFQKNSPAAGYLVIVTHKMFTSENG